ncbi:MAG: carbohydrate-binding family 9-like protein [Bryobacteraceae bacterium]
MQRLLILLAVAQALPAQTLSSYDIRRAAARIVIDGKLDDPAWRQATEMGEFHFPWLREGTKEQTVARMLWDDENLYVGYYCHDTHISAFETKRHGPVSKDDCVEIFISPNPEKVTNYYTFEINAIGTMLNRCRTDWWKGPPTWEPENVRYRTSFHGLPKKEESPGDNHWVVEMAIPLHNFARDAAHMPPRDGDRWRLNLNRTGGITNRQSSSWSPIPTPAPAFHTPTAFGSVRFVAAAPMQAAQAAGRRGGRNQRETNPLGRGVQVVADGRALYNRSCTMCHGLDGAVGDRAPALAGNRRFLRTSDQDLFDAISKGLPGTAMPPMGLPGNDTWKIVAYIRSLRASAYEDHVTGDRVAGERIFWGKGNCGACHTLNGRGGLLGPDLSDVGAGKTLAALKETLTQPLPHVPRGYQPVVLTTADGRSLSGVLKNENNFSLQLLDKENRLHLLLREELKDVQYGNVSLMPRDFDKTLSAAEFQNLLAFLSRQARSRAREDGTR